MENGIERRAYQRIKLETDIKYKILSDSSESAQENFYNSKTFNLSKGGIGLIMKHKLEAGKVVKVEVNMENGTQKIIKAFCEVRWCNESDKDGIYQSGLSFLAVKEDDSNFLSDFIEEQIKRNN